MSDKSARRSLIKLPRMSAMLTYPRSNTREPGHYASLRIEDEDSHQIVATIDLNPDQLFILMSNGQAYGEGEANANVHRLGLHYEHQTIRLDRAEWGLEYDSTEDHNAIRANMKVLRDEGWEVVTHQRKRGEHYLECTRWVPAEPTDG